MKLHEFEIGHARACTPSDRNAVAGGNGGVSGLTEHLTGAASGQQHRARLTFFLSRAIKEPHTDTHVIADDQIDDTGVVVHADARLAGYPRPQKVADRPPGRIARVQHASYAM